jgi:hypothetical protein
VLIVSLDLVLRLQDMVQTDFTPDAPLQFMQRASLERAKYMLIGCLQH